MTARLQRSIRLLLLASGFILVLLAGASNLSAQQQKPANQSSQQAGAKPGQSGPEAYANDVEKTGSESEAGEDAFKHSAAIKMFARLTRLSVENAYWLAVVINFVIMFGVLWFLLRKIIPAAFKARTASIQEKLAEARKMSEEARQRLSDVEGRLSRLDSEIAQMKTAAEAISRSEEQRILAAGEEERRRIVTSAEQEIETAANLARRDLKAYAAELAVNMAEKKIRVAPDADAALVREFTMGLGKDGE
jgi:F-type H+-transporting ATPase subunit b